ncbi:hypothetical protein CEXT_240541 [Caerostris extrusa]|uniref:Uncharacterized protein n=1 Tax=Caerostris extrusa TaxID=172846 RepID=A0AAV4QEM4_CAEEX|nr:hypothetical protein CEXT_240541 [Caerostris extrusa]
MSTCDNARVRISHINTGDNPECKPAHKQKHFLRAVLIDRSHLWKLNAISPANGTPDDMNSLLGDGKGTDDASQLRIPMSKPNSYFHNEMNSFGHFCMQNERQNGQGLFWLETGEYLG